MIYKKCIMTINKNNATLDEDIYLFRLDKNIELHFSIVNNKYKFDKSDLNNIIAQTNAAYFQIRLYRSDEIKYTFTIQPTQDGVAVLTITDDLINDPIELGEYDFQISLLDADKTSMISMPIVKQQLHVCEPLVDNQAIMGKAVLGLSNLASGEIKNAFDSEGNYIREIHNDGDILSAQLVNKFEEALDSNTKAIKNNKDTNSPHTISSKVLGTVPASNIQSDNDITINNVSINKDRKYYIEFLGIKKLCSLLLDKEDGNSILCNIGNYNIYANNYLTDIAVLINKTNEDDTTTVTFTDLVIYEEEIKYLDSKYIENDLVLQNSISLGRIGNIGAGSSAVGYGVEASGEYSHAEGGGSTASGDYSHVECSLTTASGNYSHAEGRSTKAIGVSSHTEGDSTVASGDGSHAEGYSTTASGNSSHAEGKYTIAEGNYSHAEGINTTASGTNSHAEGTNTIASSDNQHVQGRYNIEDDAGKYVHIVGNGAEDDYSNAHTLDWQGNAWYAGKLSQEGTPTDNNDLATKKYVDDKGLKEYIGTKENPVLFTEIKGGWSIVKNYYKWYAEYENPIPCGDMLVHKFPFGKNFYITYMNGSELTRYSYNVTTHAIKGYKHALSIEVLTKDNTQEYTPTNDYNPATKKYVDDKVASSPQLSFNENGELVVTINGVSKTFVPKAE